MTSTAAQKLRPGDRVGLARRREVVTIKDGPRRNSDVVWFAVVDDHGNVLLLNHWDLESAARSAARG